MTASNNSINCDERHSQKGEANLKEWGNLLQVTEFLTVFHTFYSWKEDIISPQEIESTLQYRQLLQNCQEIEGKISCLPDDIKKENNNFLQKLLEDTQRRLGERPDRDKELDDLLRRFEVWSTKALVQDILLYFPETDKDDEDCSHTVWSSLLNLPSAKYLEKQIPSLERSRPPVRNHEFANLMSSSASHHTPCSIILPPNSYTWKEYSRICYMVSLLPPEVRYASHQSSCCGKTTVTDATNIYTTTVHFKSTDLVALWVRAQRNFQAMRHLYCLFSFTMKTMDEWDALPSSSLKPLRAIYKGNYKWTRKRVLLSKFVDNLVNWAVTNQVLFTFHTFRKSLTSTRKRKHEGALKSMKRRRIVEDNQYKHLLRAKHIYLLRWLFRRNRKILTPYFEAKSSEINSWRGNSKIIALQNMPSLLRDYMLEAGGNILYNRTFNAMYELIYLGKYDDIDGKPSQFSLHIEALLLELKNCINNTWKDLAQSSLEDFKGKYQSFVKDDRQTVVAQPVYESCLEGGDKLIEAWENAPAPWKEHCFVCSNITESHFRVCLNCERKVHYFCSKSCTNSVTHKVDEVVKRFKPLRDLCVIPNNSDIPDYRSKETVKWETVSLTVDRKNPEGGSLKRLGLQLIQTEMCADELEDLLSKQTLVSELTSAPKIPPLLIPEMGCLVNKVHPGDDFCGEASGFRVGDVITTVELITFSADSEKSKFKEAIKYDLSKLLYRERLELFRIPVTLMKVSVRRPSENIVRRSFNWFQRLKDSWMSSVRKNDSLWYCGSCKPISQTFPLNVKCTNKKIYMEALNCQAVIRRLCMENYSFPFHEELLENQKLSKKHLACVSLRRLDSMMSYIISKNVASDTPSKSARFRSENSFYAARIVDGNSERLSWAPTEIETNPLELLCRGIGLLLRRDEIGADHTANKLSQEQKKTFFSHFFSLFSAWCLYSSDGLANGEPTGIAIDACSPWIHHSCDICTVCPSLELYEGTHVCNSRLCRDEIEHIFLQKQTEISPVMDHSDADMIVEYDERASLVGTTVLVLPDDPLVDFVCKELKFEIEHYDRAIEFIVAAYVPPNLCVEQWDVVNKKGGLFFLLPVLSQNQLEFLLKMCKAEHLKTPVDELAINGWIEDSVLGLKGVARISYDELHLKLQRTHDCFEAITNEVANLALCTNPKAFNRDASEHVDTEVRMGLFDDVLTNVNDSRISCHFPSSDFHPRLSSHHAMISSANSIQHCSCLIESLLHSRSGSMLSMMNKMFPSGSVPSSEVDGLDSRDESPPPDINDCDNCSYLSLSRDYDEDGGLSSRRGLRKADQLAILPIHHTSKKILSKKSFFLSRDILDNKCSLVYSDLYYENCKGKLNLENAFRETHNDKAKHLECSESNSERKNIVLFREQDALSESENAGSNCYSGIGWGFELICWKSEMGLDFIRVGRVHPESIAASSGLRMEDIVLSINGMASSKIHNQACLVCAILGCPLINAPTGCSIESIASVMNKIVPLGQRNGPVVLLVDSSIKRRDSKLSKSNLFYQKINSSEKQLPQEGHTPGGAAACIKPNQNSQRGATYSNVVSTFHRGKQVVPYTASRTDQNCHSNRVSNPVHNHSSTINTVESQRYTYEQPQNNWKYYDPQNQYANAKYKNGWADRPSRSIYENFRQQNCSAWNDNEILPEPMISAVLKQLYKAVVESLNYRPIINNRDLYHYGLSGTVLTKSETSCLLEAIYRGFPMLGLRLLCPRYELKVICAEVEKVMIKVKDLCTIPQISDKMWENLIIFDYGRSERENQNGSIVFKDGIHRYRIPTEALPIDRILEFHINTTRILKREPKFSSNMDIFKNVIPSNDSENRISTDQSKNISLNLKRSSDSSKYDNQADSITVTAGNNEMDGVAESQSTKNWFSESIIDLTGDDLRELLQEHDSCISKPPLNSQYASSDQTQEQSNTFSIETKENGPKYSGRPERIRGGAGSTTSTENSSDEDECLFDIPMSSWCDKLVSYTCETTYEGSAHGEAVGMGYVKFQMTPENKKDKRMIDSVPVLMFYLSNVGIFAESKIQEIDPRFLFLVADDSPQARIAAQWDNVWNQIKTSIAEPKHQNITDQNAATVQQIALVENANECIIMEDNIEEQIFATAADKNNNGSHITPNQMATSESQRTQINNENLLNELTQKESTNLEFSTISNNEMTLMVQQPSAAENANITTADNAMLTETVQQKNTGGNKKNSISEDPLTLVPQEVKKDKAQSLLTIEHGISSKIPQPTAVAKNTPMHNQKSLVVNYDESSQLEELTVEAEDQTLRSVAKDKSSQNAQEMTLDVATNNNDKLVCTMQQSAEMDVRSTLFKNGIRLSDSKKDKTAPKSQSESILDNNNKPVQVTQQLQASNDQCVTVVERDSSNQIRQQKYAPENGGAVACNNDDSYQNKLQVVETENQNLLPFNKNRQNKSLQQEAIREKRSVATINANNPSQTNSTTDQIQDTPATNDKISHEVGQLKWIPAIDYSKSRKHTREAISTESPRLPINEKSINSIQQSKIAESYQAQQEKTYSISSNIDDDSVQDKQETASSKSQTLSSLNNGETNSNMQYDGVLEANSLLVSNHEKKKNARKGAEAEVQMILNTNEAESRQSIETSIQEISIVEENNIPKDIERRKHDVVEPINQQAIDKLNTVEIESLQIIEDANLKEMKSLLLNRTFLNTIRSKSLGGLPDGRCVFWFPNDKDALYVGYNSERAACRKKLAAAERSYCVDVNSDFKNRGSLGIRNSEDRCCVWGCSFDAATTHSHNESREVVAFSSLHELARHVVEHYSYCSGSDSLHNFGQLVRIEGDAIFQLCSNLASAICARCASMLEFAKRKPAVSNCASTGQSFLFSPTSFQPIFDFKGINECKKSLAGSTVRSSMFSNIIETLSKIILLFDSKNSCKCQVSDIEFQRFHQTRKKLTREIRASSKIMKNIIAPCNQSQNNRLKDCELCQLGTEEVLRCRNDKTDISGSKTYAGIGCSLISNFLSPFNENSTAAVNRLGNLTNVKEILLRLISHIPGSLRCEGRSAKQSSETQQLYLLRQQLWENDSIKTWQKFVVKSHCIQMLAQSYIVLLYSIHTERLPHWWNEEGSGWYSSQTIMTLTSESCLLLHLYIFDVALMEFEAIAPIRAPQSVWYTSQKHFLNSPKGFDSMSTERKTNIVMERAKSLLIPIFSGSHTEFCRICDDGGDLLCCEFCDSVQHSNCCIPPLQEMPEFWVCDPCMIDIMAI